MMMMVVMMSAGSLREILNVGKLPGLRRGLKVRGELIKFTGLRRVAAGLG